VANSLNNLAGLYHDQGKFAEAEPLLQRALKIFEEWLGSEHPTTRKSRKNYEALLNKSEREKG
jgi:tetratricopeptide (TPR) repeat protein